MIEMRNKNYIWDEFREARKKLYSLHLHAASEAEKLCLPCGNICEWVWYATCPIYKERAKQIPVEGPVMMDGDEYQSGKWQELSTRGKQIEVLKIFYVPVNKAVVDELIDHIVARMKNAKNGPIDQTIWNIEALEELRGRLHAAVLIEAGYEVFETSKETIAFKWALEEYVEQQVMKIVATGE